MSPTPQHPRDAPSDGLRAARAVAHRLDEDILPRIVGLEEGVRDVERQVEGLGKGLAVLMAREQQTPAGQPDWIGCRHRGKASNMLLNVRNWVDVYGVHLGVGAPPCWTYHPDMVALLMAIALQHKAAYKGDSPLAVADFHTRLWPGMRSQLTHMAGRGKTRCHQTTHYIDATGYAVDYDQVEALVAWWAESREGVPPGLTPKVDAG